MHTIRVSLAARAVSNDNGNYTLTSSIEQNVTVVGKVIKISESDIKWRYSDGQSVSDLEPDQEIPYTGKTIALSINTTNLAEKGVRVDYYTDETGLDVGT